MEGEHFEKQLQKLDDKDLSFHFSVDDVLPALIAVTDENLPLVAHPFFKQLRYIYEQYGVRTGLNLFYSYVIDGRERYLHEVRVLKEELTDDWLYFAPHALNFDTPPYMQAIVSQLSMVKDIVNEIDRIACGSRSTALRFHHYSECFEIADELIHLGFNEIFLTDKDVGSHRLPKWQRELILMNGGIVHNNLKMTRTHYRVENLANDKYTDEQLLRSFSDTLTRYSRVIIYSHEYEHVRDEVNVMLSRAIRILVDELGLKPDRP